MKEFSTRHPIIFEILLIIIGFIIALGFTIVGQIFYLPTEVSAAIGRILAGCILLLVFHRCFNPERQFSGLLIMLPALLFAVWNVVYHFLTVGGFDGYQEYALILGLAPAVFEEVIFRGIFIYNLKAGGRKPMEVLIIPAFLFGVIHLTNAVGVPLAQVLLQTAYAIVIGLVLGAIYIRSGDLASLIIVHAAIDISNRLFPGGSSTPLPILIMFVILLAGETAYAFFLMSGVKDGSPRDGGSAA